MGLSEVVPEAETEAGPEAEIETGPEAVPETVPKPSTPILKKVAISLKRKALALVNEAVPELSLPSKIVKVSKEESNHYNHVAEKKRELEESKRRKKQNAEMKKANKENVTVSKKSKLTNMQEAELKALGLTAVPDFLQEKVSKKVDENQCFLCKKTFPDVKEHMKHVRNCNGFVLPSIQFRTKKILLPKKKLKK